MDQLRSMEAFVRVARLGGFTRAAQAIDVSTATVTSLVQQLEQHFGVALFHRTTRRVTLTTDGIAALERVERVLQDLTELHDTLRGGTQRAKGRLRVDVPASFGRHVLAPALPDFLAKHPDIELLLGSSDRPVELLRENVDCVVRGGTLFDDSLVARKLRTLRVITCAAPSYLDRYGTPQTLEELATHRAVRFFSARTNEVFAFDFMVQGKLIERSLPYAIACNDADTFLACGVAGLGLLQTPVSAHVKRLLKKKKLVQVLSQYDCGNLPLYVLYPQTRHLSARIRAFVDWLVSSLPK